MFLLDMAPVKPLHKNKSFHIKHLSNNEGVHTHQQHLGKQLYANVSYINNLQLESDILTP